MINLKVATQEDFDILKKMCILFLEESPYRSYPRELHKIEALIGSFLVGDLDKTCVLAYHKDKPIGMIAGAVSETLFSHHLVASEVVWWIDPDHRRKSRAALELLGAFEHWARLNKASFVQMQCLTGLSEDVVGRIYNKLGYNQTEIAYVKELD